MYNLNLSIPQIGTAIALNGMATRRMIKNSKGGRSPKEDPDKEPKNWGFIAFMIVMVGILVGGLFNILRLYYGWF